MKIYTEYNESGIEWLGKIPSTWNIKCLKFLADVIPSNIDKKSVDGEKAVRLCNYVDVYKNQYITNGIDFMWATATDAQITKLTLQHGDVIATKDSEDPNDIAVPALVTEDFEDVVCGYHLTLMRPNQTELQGGFLFWLLNSKGCNQFFATQAKGVTRYAVGISSFKNLAIPVPTIDEQTQIAKYLDFKTSQIDKLITDKEKLIELLNEERTAIINKAITKGLNPDVQMKDSGFEWLGEVPEHWDVLSFRFCISLLTDFTANGSFASLAENVTYADEGYSRLVRLTDLRVGLVNEGVYVDENAHNFLKKSELFGGELLIANVGAYAGLVCKMPAFKSKATLGPNMFLLHLNQNTDYFIFQLNASFCAEQLKMMSVSSAQPKLNKDNIRQLKVVKPPIDEQNKIVDFVNQEENRISLILSNIQQEIQLLKEYKTALISEVVTGKVDVRDEVIAESTELVS